MWMSPHRAGSRARAPALQSRDVWGSRGAQVLAVLVLRRLIVRRATGRVRRGVDIRDCLDAAASSSSVFFTMVGRTARGLVVFVEL
jgi:hypothetical protein